MNTRKRKTLFSLLFDIGELKFENAIVTCYHYLEDDTINVFVRSGYVELKQFRKNIPLEKIKNWKSRKDILQVCRFAIDKVLPYYKGNQQLSDFYYSSHLCEVHYAFGITNVENEPMPI